MYKTNVILTSAKTGENIEKVFSLTCEKLYPILINRKPVGDSDQSLEED
jgi:hypothetical protein